MHHGISLSVINVSATVARCITMDIVLILDTYLFHNSVIFRTTEHDTQICQVKHYKQCEEKINNSNPWDSLSIQRERDEMWVVLLIFNALTSLYLCWQVEEHERSIIHAFRCLLSLYLRTIRKQYIYMYNIYYNENTYNCAIIHSSL